MLNAKKNQQSPSLGHFDLSKMFFVMVETDSQKNSTKQQHQFVQSSIQQHLQF